jgi:uncharacterized membrane protein
MKKFRILFIITGIVAFLYAARKLLKSFIVDEVIDNVDEDVDYVNPFDDFYYNEDED